MSHTVSDSSVTVVSYESGICTLDKIGDFAVEMDFSTPVTRFVCEGRHTVSLEIDESDQRAKVHIHIQPASAHFYIISGGKVISLDPSYWSTAVARKFIFFIQMMPSAKSIKPAKRVAGSVFPSACTVDRADELSRDTIFSRNTALLQALDSAIPVDGSTEFVSLVALSGEEVKFPMKWFDESAANRYKHTMKAGHLVETDYTSSGLLRLRLALLGANDQEFKKCPPSDTVEAAKAAHCFGLIDCSITLLGSLPVRDLAEVMSNIPFSADPRFSCLVVRVLSRIGLSVPDSVNFGGASLGAIVRAIVDERAPEDTAKDGNDTACEQPAKRARTDSED